MAGVGKLLKQAQKMQKAMEVIQSDLNNKEIEHSAGGGAVKVIVNGHGVLKSMTLDKDFLKEDAETVASLIVSAVKEASEKAKKTSEEEMSKVTGGFSMPGLF